MVFVLLQNLIQFVLNVTPAPFGMQNPGAVIILLTLNSITVDRNRGKHYGMRITSLQTAAQNRQTYVIKSRSTLPSAGEIWKVQFSFIKSGLQSCLPTLALNYVSERQGWAIFMIHVFKIPICKYRLVVVYPAFTRCNWDRISVYPELSIHTNSTSHNVHYIFY